MSASQRNQLAGFATHAKRSRVGRAARNALPTLAAGVRRRSLDWSSSMQEKNCRRPFGVGRALYYVRRSHKITLVYLREFIS
jgi:hypothetical protein